MSEQFMRLCIEIGLEGIEKKGHGPFAAVIAKDNVVAGMGTNRVTTSHDPTAHAEITAIRDACSRLKTFSLRGYVIYTSCEPCPMCLGAILWSRLDKIYYGATRIDAAKANFDDQAFYDEISKTPLDRNVPMIEVLRSEAIKLFDAWDKKTDKVLY